MKICLCVPTLNAGEYSNKIVKRLGKQSVQPDTFLVLDSSSDDKSDKVFKSNGAIVHRIERKDFDHGGTRNLAFQEEDADIYIFITQDAIFANEYAIENILKPFEDEKVGICYGRQLPAQDATPMAEHARMYNYPDDSRKASKKDIPSLGIKAAFCSNSFAAYRKEAIEEIGFFPSKLIFGEDSFAAGKVILSGWSVAYVADAKVVHSHNYSLGQEVSRYFDMGVFHAETPWIKEEFGGAEGEGMRFINSEIAFLKKKEIRFAAFKVIIRSGFKYVGYVLGQKHKFLPKFIKLKLTMNKAYW